MSEATAEFLPGRRAAVRHRGPAKAGAIAWGVVLLLTFLGQARKVRCRRASPTGLDCGSWLVTMSVSEAKGPRSGSPVPASRNRWHPASRAWWPSAVRRLQAQSTVRQSSQHNFTTQPGLIDLSRPQQMIARIAFLGHPQVTGFTAASDPPPIARKRQHLFIPQDYVHDSPLSRCDNHRVALTGPYKQIQPFTFVPITV
jgi:hypothetical protein